MSLVASAGELVYCYNVIRPTHVMPIHGEWRHLTANAELAIRTGVNPDNVLIAEDGVVIDLIDQQASITGRVPAGMVFVDGVTVGGASEDALNERRRLAEDGGITILAILDPTTGTLTEPVEFFAHGLVHSDDWTTDVTASINDAVAKANKTRLLDALALERLMTSTVARWMQRRYRSNPVITSVVVTE